MGNIKYFHADSINSLYYCFTEHSNLDPFIFIENHVKNLGILVLGNDGQSTSNGEYANRLIEWGVENNIPVTRVAGFPWLTYQQ